MTDLLYIGASGARAYRAALAGVADNIANADNPDYVRRAVTLSETDTIGHGSPLYAGRTAMQGAAIGDVTRGADAFADQALRFALGQSGGAATRAAWFGLTEAALGDGPQGVGARLSAFYASADALAAAPGDPALRATMLAALDDVTRAFNGTAGRLDSLGGQISRAADAAAADINAALTTLADTNRALRSAQPGSARAAFLFDQRDAALHDLAELMPIDVQYGDFGQASVTTIGGAALLSGTIRATLGALQAANGTLTWVADGAPLVPFATGIAGGLSDAASALATRRTTLDGLASGFAAALNQWQAAGQDQGGQPGVPLLTGTSAATLMLTFTDSASIAASDGSTLNGNLLALPALRISTGTDAGWDTLVGGMALQTQSAQREGDAAAAQTDLARKRRDAVSGVDLDREAADLLRLQQSYEAAARVMQVARDTMQSILAIF